MKWFSHFGIVSPFRINLFHFFLQNFAENFVVTYLSFGDLRCAVELASKLLQKRKSSWQSFDFDKMPNFRENLRAYEQAAAAATTQTWYMYHSVRVSVCKNDLNNYFNALMSWKHRRVWHRNSYCQCYYRIISRSSFSLFHLKEIIFIWLVFFRVGTCDTLCMCRLCYLYYCIIFHSSSVCLRVAWTYFFLSSLNHSILPSSLPLCLWFPK